MPSYPLKTPLLGLFPYVLIQIPEQNNAQIDAGGLDVHDADELRYLAKATRAAAKGLRRHARIVAKAQRAAQRAARKEARP